MPVFSRLSEAQAAISQAVRQPENQGPVIEVERRIEALSREDRAILRTKALAWAKDHFPAFIWEPGSNFRTAAWRISEANVFCRENGMRVPKPYANIKPLKSIGKKPLVKGMGERKQVDAEERKGMPRRQASGYEDAQHARGM